MSNPPFYVSRQPRVRPQNPTKPAQSLQYRQSISKYQISSARRPPSTQRPNIQTEQTLKPPSIHIKPHQFTSFAVPLPHLEQETPKQSKSHLSKNTTTNTASCAAMAVDITDDLNEILGLNDDHSTDSDSAPILEAIPPPKKKRKLTTNGSLNTKTHHKKRKKHKKQSKTSRKHKDKDTNDTFKELLRQVDRKYEEMKQRYDDAMNGMSIEQNAQMAQKTTMESEIKQLKAINIRKNKDLKQQITMNGTQMKKIQSLQVDNERLNEENNKYIETIDDLEHKTSEHMDIIEKYEKLKQICMNTCENENNVQNADINEDIFRINEDKTVFDIDEDIESMDVGLKEYEYDMESLKDSLEDERKKKMKYRNMMMKYKDKFGKLEEEMNGLNSKIDTMEKNDWNGVIAGEYTNGNGEILYQMKWDDSYGLTRNDVTEKDLKKWEKKKKKKRKRSK